MTAPEPLMPLLIARKPGGKPLEVLIDEATGERLLRDIAVALEGIRAAKRVMAVMMEPPLPPSVVFEPAFCGQRYFDGDAWQDCAEPAGHDGLHGDQPPDASADSGELPAPSASDEVRAAMLDELRSRPGYPHGGGRAQMAAQRAMDEQQVDAAIADGLPANTRYCPDGPTVEHGPCARLAGHPVPHRDIHGSEWFPGGGTRAPEDDDDSFPSCARHGCKHLESRHDDGHGGCTFPGCTCEAYDPHDEPDEPMPVSFLPLNRAALIGGGA